MLSRITLIGLVGLLLALPMLAQGNPTGKLTGRVTADGAALPGVSVTVTSPNLQGTRTTQTSISGDYIFAALPAGDYSVTFELDGMQPQKAEIVISAAQTKKFNTELRLSEISEEIVVTGNRATFSETSEGATTYKAETVESLPIGRNMESAVLLSPGAHNTGPAVDQDRNVITISGGQSFENLFLVNGVVVNENLRGQPLDLFIEDAIQETTTSASGITAEYGRFTGGVVNVLTKSGGNQVSGSLRTSLTNQDWEARTPLTVGQEDQVNDTLEATLGGYFWKDRLWYFAAGRTFDRSTLEQLQSGIEYPKERSQDRIEGKLTASLTERNTLVGSFIDIDDQDTNNDPFGIALEVASLSSRADPQTLAAVNYTGIVTDSFFVEAQYSEREFSVAQGGGATGEGRIDGTHFIDVQNSAATFYIPYFCGTCRDETRDNEAALIKGAYFASSKSTGSHDVVFGFETFSDLVVSENHQSPSGFSIWTDTAIVRGTEVFPVVTPGIAEIWFFPIETSSLGSDFTTESFFANDTWQLNDRWSFNIGLRYDQNDGVDSSGATVSDDTALSPRLSAAYDVKGNGNLVVNASYGQYVAGLNFGVGDTTSTAGTYSIFYFDYQGPGINQDPDAATLTTSRDAMQVIFDWFESAGDVGGAPLLFAPIIPGVSNIVPEGGLKSPTGDEITLGFTKRLGSKGLVRADLVRREWGDFYAIRRDLTTGQNTTPELGTFDVGEVVNDNSVTQREYTGLHAQFTYRFSDKFTLAGNYALSNAEGNFDGENRDSGPLTATATQYPEYKAFPQNNPEGDLGVDSRHKLRLWAIWDVLQRDHHNLNLSVLYNFSSGQPYGALGAVESAQFIDNPGYVSPPSEVSYWFTARDEFTTDDITSIDLAVNYSFLWDGWGKQFEIFLQPEIVNLLNDDGQLLVNQTVLDATNAAGFETFDPFTETPVQGVHWDFGSNFGQATRDVRFQQPRTFRLSVGFRF